MTEIGDISIINVQSTYDSSWSVLIMVSNIMLSHVTPSVERDTCAKWRVYTHVQCSVYTHVQCSV